MSKIILCLRRTACMTGLSLLILGLAVYNLMDVVQAEAGAAVKPAPVPDVVMTGSVQFAELGGGFYGILGDDGLKYQPTNLDYKYRQNELKVKFKAISQPDRVSFIQWGKIIEITSLDKLSPQAADLSLAEWTAIHVLQKRLDAYNKRDLAALQKIDDVAQDLTAEQFETWLDKYSNFTLQYVEIATAESMTITGTGWYTREIADNPGAENSVQLSITKFILTRTENGWKLTGLDSGNTPTAVYTLQALEAKAKEKYGVAKMTDMWR